MYLIIRISQKPELTAAAGLTGPHWAHCPDALAEPTTVLWSRSVFHPCFSLGGQDRGENPSPEKACLSNNSNCFL